MKKITSLITLFLIPFSFVAQWNPDITINTSVSDRLATNEQHITTAGGKTFITYDHFVNGIDYLYLQLLDQNGNKMYGDDGVLLGQNSTESITPYLFLQVDSQENCYVAYCFSLDETRLYKVGSNGQILLSDIIIAEGMVFSFELSENNELVFMTENHIKKYNSEGILTWDKDLSVLSELTTQTIISGEIKFDNEGSFYALMGISLPGFGNVGYTNYFLQKYNSDGEAVWTNLIPLIMDQTFMSYTPGMFLYPAKIEVVDSDALVTIPLWYSNLSCTIYGQRFSSSNGERMWNEDVLPMIEITDYFPTIQDHAKYYNEVTKELYITVTVAENNPEPNAPEKTSVIFQRIDVENGNRLNSNGGSVVIPLSAELPINTSIKMCNNEIVLDVLTREFDIVTSTGTNMISLYKISEMVDSWIEYTVKSTATRVGYGFFFSDLFNIDATGQAVVVFMDNRSSNPEEFYLFAQNAILCENTSDIDERKSFELSVYPNPVKDILNFDFEEQVSSIEVYSLDGKTMLQKDVENQNLKLDVSNWMRGVYIYSITSQKGIRSNGKFIKE